MSSILKELRKNRYTIIVFFIFLGLFLIGWAVFGLVMPKNNGEQYGNRLDDIKEEYGSLEKAQESANEVGEKIINEIKKKSYVKDAKIDVKGKIINIIIEVKSDARAKTTKELGDIVLKTADDKTKKLYDFQLFIKNENKKAKGFPIIGYKNSSDKGFVF